MKISPFIIVHLAISYFIFYIIFVYYLCICGDGQGNMHAPKYMSGDHRTTFKSELSPFNIWIQGTKLKSPGLGPRASTCRVFSPALLLVSA